MFGGFRNFLYLCTCNNKAGMGSPGVVGLGSSNTTKNINKDGKK